MNELNSRVKKGFQNNLFLLIILFFMLSVVSLSAQGLLLRGEKWQKFSMNGKTADFYVSPDGNDSWSGILDSPDKNKNDGPFKTIQRAKEAVRELKTKIYTPEEIPIDRRYIGSPHNLGDGRDILVLIRDGYYSLKKPLQFTPEDGGERVETNLPSGAFEYHKLKDYFVTYAAYPGEHPIISGGQQLSTWKKENDIWVTDAKNLDVKKLLINGNGLTLARTPNNGYFTFPTASKNTTSFSFNSGEIESWPDMEDNRIKMYLRWHYGINSISKVDEENNLAYLKKPEDGIIVISPRYYIENVKALLDSPGEWFYEKKSEKVFLIPPENINSPNDARSIVPVLQDLIIIEGEQNKPVRNLRFYGLSFEGTESGGSAISIKYGNKCEVVESRISEVGGSGIYVGYGTFQMRILSNKIIRAAEGGVNVVGNPYPDNWSEIIREVTISQNYIAQCGRTSVHASNALYTIISHNEITDNLGRYPIYVGGWSNLEEAIDGGYRVEYNHIHNVQSLADDSGVITTGGYTYNSNVKGNLIHHVKKGEFNDNVAIWFDNMSYGWIAEDNIMYALEQGEMKLCAANLVDNLYKNNYRIETPLVPQRGIIIGSPKYEYGELKIENSESKKAEKFNTGEFANISVNVINNGATGINDVTLSVNGIVVDTKRIPIVENNLKLVTFDYLFSQPGEHRISIGSSPLKVISVEGKPLSFFYDSINVSSDIIPARNEIIIKARVKKVSDKESKTEAILYANSKVIATQQIEFGNSDTKNIEFKYSPKAGDYKIRIGNSKSIDVVAYPFTSIDISKVELAQYCDTRAEPHKINVNQENNKFKIEASGIDFCHGEDSYAAVYLKNPIKGNFVATVKLTGFGERTNEWFRSGLFVRNDMEKSFGTGEGSKGSVLMFASPGRAGMNWDEHGDGCMHKANSENHPVNDTYPIWIKLVRHGNSFSGYVSYDGKNRAVERHTKDLPGINEAVHIGLAAGAPDQLVYFVEFEDLQIFVEK